MRETSEVTLHLTNDALHSFCKVETFFVQLNNIGNIYSYLFITIDRVIYFECAMRYTSIVTQKRALQAIVMGWLAVFIQSSTVIAWESDENSGGENRTYFCNVLNENLFRQGSRYFAFIQRFFLTFCVLAPLYGKITRTAWRLIQTDPHLSHFDPEGQAKQRKKIQERKLTVTVAITFGFYLLCNLPPLFFFGVLRHMYQYQRPLPFWILFWYKFFVFWFRLQIVLNPIFYAMKNSMMKKAYRRLFFKNSVGANME